jgi:hypothetical protein
LLNLFVELQEVKSPHIHARELHELVIIVRIFIRVRAAVVLTIRVLIRITGIGVLVLIRALSLFVVGI